MGITIELPGGGRVSSDKDAALIGRDRGCDICLPDLAGVEPRHARIRKVGDRWLVESQGDWTLRVGEGDPSRVGWLKPGDSFRLTTHGPKFVFEPVTPAPPVRGTDSSHVDHPAPNPTGPSAPDNGYAFDLDEPAHEDAVAAGNRRPRFLPGKSALRTAGAGCLSAALALAACGALIGIGAELARRETPAARTRQEATPAPGPIEKAGAPVANLSWEEINEIYRMNSSYSDLQRSEKWKSYRGRKVTWRGKVRSLGETFGVLQLQIQMNPDTLTSDLLIRLEAGERSKALKFREGDTVTFRGVLKEWGRVFPITLTDGEIVE